MSDIKGRILDDDSILASFSIGPQCAHLLFNLSDFDFIFQNVTHGIDMLVVFMQEIICKLGKT